MQQIECPQVMYADKESSYTAEIIMVAVQVSRPLSRTPLRIQNLRVNNVEIPNSKKVEISLQYIYGIGSTTAKAILRDTVSIQQPSNCSKPKQPQLHQEEGSIRVLSDVHQPIPSPRDGLV